MLRFALVLLLVFAIPFLVHFGWRLVRGDRDRPPLGLLIGAGFACSVAALVTLSLVDINRGSRDGAYAPPSLEDGQVRPGRFEERERAPSDAPAR